MQPAASGQSGTAEDVLVTCAASVDEGVIGLTDLDAECAGLEPALVDAGFAPFLSETQSEALTSQSLSDLAQLRDYYARPISGTPVLQVNEIENIVRSLEQAKAARSLTLKERLSRWLRQAFDRRQVAGDSWLTQWLRGKSVPQQVTDVLLGGLVLLVVVLVVIVLTNELRAAGVLKRSTRKRLVRTASGDHAAVRLTFADIESAPLREQPSRLLQLVVSALVDGGRLSGAYSLTHRELTNRASFDTPDQHHRFEVLASGAQYARYSGDSLSVSEIDTLIVGGRELYAQITRTPTASDKGLA